MSSVDPSWGPPGVGSAAPGGPSQGYPRPPRLAWVLAVVLPVLLVLGLVAPLGITWGVSRLRSPAAADRPATPPVPVPVPDQGQPGVGDPYFPGYGSSGYDALRYAISVSWDPGSQTLTGTTVISARATQPLTAFYLDLALTTERVLVDGQPASFDLSGFSDVLVTPARPVAAGADFEVSVDYSGRPGEVRQAKISGWYATGAEWMAAGEPESSAWWFPANDHPSDPALMDVSVRVPAGMEAVSVGRLESRDSGNEARFDTWHWVADQPMATYLNVMALGQFVLQQGVEDGRPYVYAVSEQLAPEERLRAFSSLNTSGAIVRTLETMFGPYPFSELGGIVGAHKVAFDGLETQTRPVYRRDSISGEGASGLLAHELAHMWFGNNVTVKQWDDIFGNEAYASWAQWGHTERTGGRTANEAFHALFDRAEGRPDFWRITMIDPGREHLFDTVYFRGPMALQALRNVIGDTAFFELARDWGQDQGSRSVEEWMVAAQAHTTVNLGPFFQAWIYSPVAPARTAANGFRG